MKTIILLISITLTLSADIKGIILNNTTNSPIENAMVSDSKNEVKTNKKGYFELKSSEEIFHVKYYGYKPYEINASNSSNYNFRITPIKVKAMYMTFWGASPKSKTFKKLLNIIDNTELNALVIDVKNEFGQTSYKTNFKQGNSYGIWHHRTIKDIKSFMKIMKEHNVYTIARLVTFKDDIQAMNNKDYAIRNEHGKIWRNGDKMAWVDPFDKRSHDYVLSIAEDAASVGFDEINFDYIRFPAKSKLQLKHKSNQTNRVKAITYFLHKAKNRLMKYGVYTSVNTYGEIFKNLKTDSNIGQKIKELALYSDYLSPMIYPSGFSDGSFGIDKPSKHPYEIIYKSLKNSEKIIDPIRLRPWLQHFTDYTSAKQKYGKREVQLQISASDDIGTNGWLLWSPNSRYKRDYFLK